MEYILPGILLAFNTLLGIVMYLQKQTHDRDREEMRELKSELKELRESAFKKADFKEFKQEIAVMFQDLRSEIKGLKNV